MGLDKRLAEVLTWERRAHLDKAVKELELVENALSRVERMEASHIHPKLRKKHDKSTRKELEYKSSGFKLLLPRFRYGLNSLNKKAPMQWFVETLDSRLSRLFDRARIEVSKLTRYKIIEEVIVSGGLPEKSAKTIKQHFVEKRKPTKPTARNSQAT
jgi:hypothetical protein